MNFARHALFSFRSLQALVYTEALSSFFCSSGDIPESATPFFKDQCLTSFWNFMQPGKKSLNPSGVSN